MVVLLDEKQACMPLLLSLLQNVKYIAIFEAYKDVIRLRGLYSKLYGATSYISIYIMIAVLLFILLKIICLMKKQKKRTLMWDITLFEMSLLKVLLKYAI